MSQSIEYPAFVTPQSLESRFGSAVYVELFDDDRDGQPDTEPLTQVLDTANADVVARLINKGYSLDQLFEISDAPMLVNCAAEIAMGFAGERRPEWLNDQGNGRYDAIRARAYTRLDGIAKALLRIPTAEARGQGTTQPGGYVSAYKLPARKFVFATDENDRSTGGRGPGGF